MGETVLRCSGLRKRYGRITAVDGVGFEVRKGEVYGLLGPNGAGKTTTVSIVCGLLRRDSGEATVAGEPVDVSATRTKALIGYVPQEVALYPDLTAEENLRFFGRLYGLRGRELERRVAEGLELVGLADRRAERVDRFSGGMKRRLNVAAGILHDPKLLVLDEPTVGVDPQSRSAILDFVSSLACQGKAVLYTTHYMEEAERMCHRVGIIDGGRIVAEGTRRELVDRLGQLDRIEVGARGDVDAFVRVASELDGVVDADGTEGGVHLVVRQGRRLLPRLLETATKVGLDVTSVEVVEPDLEAVFLHLTGRALRD